MAAAALPVVLSLVSAGVGVAGTIAGARASSKAAKQQEAAQQRALAAQREQTQRQEQRVAAQEKTQQERLSKRRRSQLAGRLGFGLGGRRSLFFEGSELGVQGEQRATLG